MGFLRGFLNPQKCSFTYRTELFQLLAELNMIKVIKFLYICTKNWYFAKDVWTLLKCHCKSSILSTTYFDLSLIGAKAYMNHSPKPCFKFYCLQNRWNPIEQKTGWPVKNRIRKIFGSVVDSFISPFLKYRARVLKAIIYNPDKVENDNKESFLTRKSASCARQQGLFKIVNKNNIFFHRHCKESVSMFFVLVNKQRLILKLVIS